MKYNHYVDGCPLVSEIGFGAWQLGNNIDWSAMTDEEAVALVHEALKQGVNFFDTAPNYALGHSERLLGIALKDIPRDTIVVSTKFGHCSDGSQNYDASAIRSSIEGSLKRLQMDYIDSVLLHSPDPKYLDGNQNEHYEIFEALKKEGLIRAYGASLENSRDMITFMETTKGQVIEAFFNILHQDTRFAFDLALEKGVAIIAKIPLDSGWLSGKYNKKSTFVGIRERWTREDIEKRSMLVDQLKYLSNNMTTLPQVAINYCLAYEAVSTVIPGAKNVKQLEANIKAIEQPLERDLVHWLEKFYDKEVVAQKLVW